MPDSKQRVTLEFIRAERAQREEEVAALKEEIIKLQVASELIDG